eukprot:jgi/Tetstr1/435164/TSEL_002620.t1
MGTLLGVRHLTKKGDYMFSFDLQDGFYALGIAEADRDYFTVDVRGQLYKLASLPMGWSLSPYYFVTLTQVIIIHLRKPEPEPPSSSTRPTRSKRYLRRTKWRGARILPYVDDFLLFSASMEQALHLHKLNHIARQATPLIGRATRNARWLSVRELQSQVGQAQYLFLAIPAARFFLRELPGRSRPQDSFGDRDDWQLDPLPFADLESRFGPHSIDRFASALNTLLPRYNAAWLDPTCEAVDSLHLPDADWRRENNWCNALWPLLPDPPMEKLRHSDAAATVVAPRWKGKAWHQALTEMAVEELTVAPRAGFFRPRRRDGRGSDTLGVQTPELLSAAWAPATAASYTSCMKQYFRFCEDERRPALAADPGTMARYVTWLGNLGTIKASSLQRYPSAVNNFFKDHGREPMALGDLVSRARKGGLAASRR